MEPSQEYLDAVAKGTQFQLRESAWLDTMQKTMQKKSSA